MVDPRGEAATPANRVNAGKARATVDVWLRQKFGKVKAPKRDTLKPPAHVKQKNWGANRGKSQGSPPKADALKDWRGLTWELDLMAVKRPAKGADDARWRQWRTYKAQIDAADRQFDALMLQQKGTHKARHHGTVAPTPSDD